MITSLSNRRVKQVRDLQARRRARYRAGMMVIEGSRLLTDALLANLEPAYVFYTAGWSGHPEALALLASLAEQEVPAVPVSDEIMAHCSDTETPQGVLAVLPLPRPKSPAQLSFVLVVDGLRTPGNLGSVLRAAAAAGTDLVYVPTGNVDPYNPKVVRGGMGAHFQLPIRTAPWGEITAAVEGMDVWLATAHAGLRYDQVDWTRRATIVLGGEARGAGQRAAELATGQVHIPMPGGTESLNAAVAAGVLLFEVARQRSVSDA